MKNFNDLPDYAQKIINERFSSHGINGSEAYNSPHLFTNELKQLPVDDILAFIDKKHISHKLPKSEFPEYKSDLGNIIFEDADTNMERGAKIMTHSEEKSVMNDYKNDIIDGDIDDDGTIDLESVMTNLDENEALGDLIGTVTPIGLFLSGAILYKHIKNKEVKLEEAPRFFVYDTGKRTVKVAVVGTLLASGSPIVVGGTIGYFLYKSKSLIKKTFAGIYNGITSDATLKVLAFTGRTIITSGMIISSIIQNSVKLSYNMITSDTTKQIGKNVGAGIKKTTIFGIGTAILTFRGISHLAKKSYSIIKKRKK
tara:strand:- start:121 stop:1056 length:936 start_codon:yes stop_codon:yes gene_type:complete